MTTRARRRLAWALVPVAVVAAIWLKVRLESGAALEHAAALEAAGDTEMAIVVYRHAVRWYSPGSGPVRAAVERLWEIGQRMEREGNSYLALMAYRSLRSALFAVRSVYQPYSEKLPPANERIAALMAAEEGAAPGTQSHTAKAADHRALLEVDRAPSVGWSLFAILSFGIFVTTLFGLATRGFDDGTGKLLPRPAARWAGILLAAAACWMLGLAQA